MKNKIFLLLGIALIFLMGTVAAAEWDNLASYNAANKTITIYNWNILGQIFDLKIAEYTLLTNTEACLTDCYAEGLVKLYGASSLFNEMKFKDKKGNIKQIKNYDWFIEVNTSYNIAVPTYEDKCNTLKNETKICDHIQNGTVQQIVYKREWQKYDGEILPEGVYKWRLEGKKSLSQNTDWVMSAFGKDFIQWAWWNADYNYCRTITLTNASDYGTRSYQPLVINLTGLSGKLANNNDVRIVNASCGNDGSEVNRTVVDSGTDYATVAFAFSGDLPTNYSVYYNNLSAVGAPNNETKLAFFDEFTGSSYDTGKWTANANCNAPVVSNGVLRLNVSYIASPVCTQDVFTTLRSFLDEFTIQTNFSSPDIVNTIFFRHSNTYTNSDNFELVYGGGNALELYAYNGAVEKFNAIGGANNFNYNVWWLNASGTSATLWKNAVWNFSNSNAFYGGTKIFSLNPIPATQGHDVYYDYIRIWNNTVNLYGDVPTVAIGSQQTASSAPYFVNNAPINYYNSSLPTIVFNKTVGDDSGILNVSLILDGVYNETNTSGFNGTYYIFTKTLADGSHNWTYRACDDSDVCANDTTLYFTVDSILPVLVVNAPTDPQLVYVLPTNITLNVTVTDSNLESCWYYTSDDSTNITFTCNDLANVSFSTDGSKVIYIWANDTVGNENSTSVSFSLNYISPSLTYTPELTEGDANRVYFNITATSISTISANLSYNETNFTMTELSNNGTYAVFYSDLFAPYVDADTYVNILAYYLLDGAFNATSTSTQLVHNLSELTFSPSPCTDLAYNFTLRDETNLTGLNGTFSYNFAYGTDTNNSISHAYGEIINSHNLYVCGNFSNVTEYTLGYGEIDYSTETHVDRRSYLFVNSTFNNQTQNITLYDLLSSDQTSFKLEVEDTSLNPYTEKYTTLVRWYPNLNEYNVVDMGITDETGSTVIHVKTEDVDYRIGVYEQNGTLIKLANPIRMVCLVSPCTYTLRISPTETDYTSFLDVDYSLDFNETSGLWTFTYSDSTQRTQEMNLTIYKLTGTSIYPICSSLVTGYSGAVTCNTSGYTGTLQGVAVRTASPPVPIAQKIVTIGTNAFSSTYGLWISLLIGLPIVMIFAFMSPLGAVIGGVLALIPAYYFGAITLAIIGGVAILAGIVLHFLKRIK